MKKSSQSENSKLAILTNELQRRFMMMDRKVSKEEKIEKIDHFCEQLINSGYKWEQIHKIVVSSLTGLKRKEERLEEGERRYRTGEESLEKRMSTSYWRLQNGTRKEGIEKKIQ